MSYPARGPGLPGIDGKASAASRRIDDVSITSAGNEAALGRHPARGPIFNGDRRKADCRRAPTPRSLQLASGTEAPRVSGSASTRPPVERVTRAKSLIRKPFAGVVLATVVMLSGCPATTEKTARPNERWYDAVVEPLQSEPERALRFYDRIIRLKAAELAQELEAVRQSYEGEKTELGRVQLAMILSLPGAAFRDDHAADQLLLPYVKDRSLEQSPLRPLALLLHAQLAENRKMDEALQQQAAKTKEEQRKAAEAQQKLEALLEMEMKMLEREQTIPTKKK